MRTAWTLLCLGVVACGSSGGGGEPQNGDATVMWGSTTDMMTVGSAVLSKTSATAITIQLGNDNVSCSTDLNNNFPPSGLYVVFDIDGTIGTNSQATIAVIHASGTHFDYNQSTGTVTVTSIDTRVMGSVMFTTTDSMAGTITATGSFDVKKCF